MGQNKVFWNYFMATGNIGAYLLFRKVGHEQGLKFKRAEKNSRDIL
ncbi:MAG TPA: YqzL family protein [Clostridia bacterium]|nr:YqzL family protein [Clostridia bacterium]